jgi:2-C-methyl-D-erythritol 4-phosphate cytidylyltransferase
MRNIHAIILAGGIGSRTGSTLPKQFLKLFNKPLVLYSLERFRSWGLCKSINIVCHKDWMELMEETVSPFLEGQDRIIEGGLTRHDSTMQGLNGISWDADDILFFHDAARPFFETIELDELVNSAQIFGASTLAQKSSDTVVRSLQGSRFTQESIPRNEVFAVKTPQAVTGKMLLKLKEMALEENNDPPTDLCSWVEKLGEKTGIIETSHKNIKVTTADDIKIAECILSL